MSYVVTDKDILFGRGGMVNQHRGNKDYRRFIAATKDSYWGLNCVDRPLFLRSIFETLQIERYQFIRFNTETKQYETVDDDEVMIKITQSFRETDKKPAAKAKPRTGRVPECPVEGAQQMEHDQQNNACPSADDHLLSDVSSSQGSSSSDWSVAVDNETDSGFCDWTIEPLLCFPSPIPLRNPVSEPFDDLTPLPFPGPLQCKGTNDVRVWQSDGSYDAIPGPDTNEMLADFLRRHVKELPVSSPDFADR